MLVGADQRVARLVEVLEYAFLRLKHFQRNAGSAGRFLCAFKHSGIGIIGKQFNTVTSMDKAAWLKELELHDELFKQLAHHLPKELSETKAAIEKRLAA